MVPRINVTTDVVAVSNVLTRAFSNSAVTSYVIREPNSTWTAPNIPLDLLEPKMLDWTSYKSKIGGELVEAGNYAAVAIWFVSLRSTIGIMCTDYFYNRFPPGVNLPASPDDDERVVEYRKVSGGIKKQFLKGRQYWYLNMIGRDPERTEPGAN